MKKQFLQLMNNVKEQRELLDKINDLIGVNSKVFEAMVRSIEYTVHTLEVLVNDKTDLITWWLYDAPDGDKTIEIDNVRYEIETENDLYNIIRMINEEA